LSAALSGTSANFTGTVTASLFSGSGASLTNIPVSGLASPTMVLGSTTVTLGTTATAIANLQLTGTPSAPTASVGTNTTQVATTAFVQAGMSNYMPRGIISMWYGSIASIPAGWALCNGLNGTPNLQDRFIVGAGNGYGVGSVGGVATYSLTVDQMPWHSHGASAWTDQQGSHQHGGYTSTVGDHQHISPWGESDARGATWGVSGGTGYQGSGQTDWDNYQYMTSPAGNHNHSITTDWQGQHGHNVGVSIAAAGSSAAIENRPPFYALAYIMKL
jgi:microcystin-dependent protein